MNKEIASQGPREVYVPFNHQYEAADFIAPMDAWALFMEQGTGKSKVVLMKAAQLYQQGKIDRLLVLCPSALKNQWQGEVLEDHCPMDYASIAWDGFGAKWKQVKFRQLLQSKKFKIMAINYEAFLPESKALLYIRQYLSEGQALVICDESTKIKNPEAKRTKTILAGFKLRPYKGILTGTPTPNSPIDLWAQFNFLFPDFFKMSYFHFKKHHCIMIKKMNPSTGRPFDIPIDEPTWKRVKYNLDKELKETKALTVLSYEKVAIRCDIPSIKDVMIINTQKKYTPYKHLDELRAKIDPYTFRQRKEDCLDLPDKIYEKLEVDLTPEQKKAIKDLRKDLYAKYEGKEISAKTVLSVTGRLQLITGGVFPYRDLEMNEEGELVEGNTKFMYMKDSPKIKALLEDLEGVAEDTQILVWAVFSSELELIYNSLKKAGYSVDLYYGATKKNERDRMEADFKAGKTRILVMQPSMGEFGLNFQCATLHYFYSNSYKADTRLQAEDRSHRIGQTNKVTYKDIHCINSIDQKIWNAICMKEEIINFFRNKSIDEIIDF